MPHNSLNPAHELGKFSNQHNPRHYPSNAERWVVESFTEHIHDNNDIIHAFLYFLDFHPTLLDIAMHHNFKIGLCMRSSHMHCM